MRVACLAQGESPGHAHRNRPVSPSPTCRHENFFRDARHFFKPARPRLVLAPACELAQNKLLSQTADHMETHVNPKCFEYVPGSTI